MNVACDRQADGRQTNNVENGEKKMTATHDSKMQQDLDARYSVTPEQIAFFRDQGYIKLKQVLSPETLAFYGEEITSQVFRLSNQTKPMSERTTYEKAFLQVGNLWTKSEVVKTFSFGRKLARIAAELMGVAGVRMYHDQALYKESGGGITPWHADQYYWPVSNANTCTVWIPLQATSMDMGPLAFSAHSHKVDMGRDLAISDESEKKIGKMLDDPNYPINETPFDLGEVSYHYGWTFHRAGENKSGLARKVMTVIYIEDGIRVVQPINKNQENDWRICMPGAQIGEVVATEMNPVLYRA